MKTQMTHNWKLKCLAFITAVIVWMIVVNINNPVRTRTISGIPVEIENDSAITSEGKVYEILNNSNVVSIEVTARRSVQLSKDDFRAVANMQDIQLMKYVPISVVCTKNVELAKITVKTPNLQISIEDSDTKTFPIVVRTTGEPGDGYVIDKDNTYASPESVRISGAVSAIEKISKVCVDVDASGLTMDTERVAALKLYDAGGNEISDSTLSFNIDTEAVDVTISFLKTKEVEITASAFGEPASGYALKSVKCEPSKVFIAGTQDALDNVSAITIPARKLNITGATEDVEQVIDITTYLPSNIQLAKADTQSVAITAAIEQLQQKTVVLPKDQVEMINVPEGMDAEFLTTADISLQINALMDDMDDLDVSSWKGTVDLSSYTEEGTYEVPLELELPEGYRLGSDAVAVVRISKKSKE